MADRLLREDHRMLFDSIEENSRVLDLGCGEGELLLSLVRYKKARVNGIEMNPRAIGSCVAKGLSVLQGDIESGLSEYPDASYDYVILNQSLQEVRQADRVIDEALRIGRRVIIGFPNFAHFKSRLTLMVRGRAPVTGALPYRWYDTPNVRFFSVRDFREFCREKGITVEKAGYLNNAGKVTLWPNLRAHKAIFLVSR